MGRERVAILHYSCPPIQGGVEFVIEAHARLLAEAGYPTKVIVGDGGMVHRKVQTVVIPELTSWGGPLADELIEFTLCRIPSTFTKAVKRIEAKLKHALKNVDVCMMHNVLTMHFNAMLSAALANVIADRRLKTRFVGWVHDATFTDPAYQKFHIPKYPWNLLSKPVKGCEYCVISRERGEQMAKLFKMPEHKLPVIPNGIDIIEMLDLTPDVAQVFQKEALYTKDIVALTPARIVRRKNLEAGLRVIAEIKSAGKSVCWMITGAPDPHNADARLYYEWLCSLRRKLRLEKEVIFLGQRFGGHVSSADLRALYRLSDVLLLLSDREGFGIPVLEAGMTGVLAVTTDIPLMKELGPCDAVVTEKGETPTATAKRVISALANSPRLCFRKRIMSLHSWDKIFADWLEPAVIAPRKVWCDG